MGDIVILISTWHQQAVFSIFSLQLSMLLYLVLVGAVFVASEDWEEECYNTDSDQWQCQSGMCVDMWSRCDGEPDCKNGEDEQGCEDWCPPLQVKCPDGNGCFDYDWLCDDRQDCEDGSDEDANMCADMYPSKK